jgi:hypothetical protein
MFTRNLIAFIAACVLAAGHCAAATIDLNFTNTNPITIPSSGNASPYPSTITGNSAPVGQIVNIQVLLNGFSHTYPVDLAAAWIGSSTTTPPGRSRRAARSPAAPSGPG